MRAYRKRETDKPPAQSSAEADETIALLRKQLARQQALLSRQSDQIAAQEPPDITFPVTIKGGRWLKIKSTSELRPGVIIRLFDSEGADVILAKSERVLTLQDLRDGRIGDLSIYDAKANWKRNSRNMSGDLVKQWIASGKPKRYVANWETEARRLETENRKLSNQVRSFKRPNHSMSVRIEKATGRPGYVAQHINGNEWAQGSTPKEALGDLVFGHAVARTVTIESVEITDPAKNALVPCPICGRSVKLIADHDKHVVPKHRHNLYRSKNCKGSNLVVDREGNC